METKHNMDFFTRFLLAFGLRARIKTLVNIVIDIAIQEGKTEVDNTDVLSQDEKDAAKVGIDLLAARLKSLVNERLDKLQ